jgi:outer membrane protein TolC
MRNDTRLMLLCITFFLVSAGLAQTRVSEDVLEKTIKENQSLKVLTDSKAVTAAVPLIGSGISLSLSSAIQIGLKNNPEIKSYFEKINASRGRFWSAISPGPLDLSITHDDIPVGQKLNNYGQKTIAISQDIDFPTNYIHRGSKYTIEKNIAKNEFEYSKLRVIFKIKKAYFNVLALQEQVRIAQENLSISKDFVKKAEIRSNVGEGSNLEKLTANVNFSEAQSNVEIQKNHLISAFTELHFAMGYEKSDAKEYQLTDTLVFVPMDFTPEQLASDAASLNPQLKTSKLQVSYYSSEKSLAWSSVLPNFNVAGFNKHVQGDATSYYGASLSIGIPLWFLLDQRGKIQEANANVSIAKSDLLMTSNSVYTNIQTAFAEFKHEEKQIQLYIKEIIPQAEEIFRTATKSYEAGEITYIEFLQAQQTLINSRGNYANALLSYNLSIVAIEEVVGKTLQ